MSATNRWWRDFEVECLEWDCATSLLDLDANRVFVEYEQNDYYDLQPFHAWLDARALK